MICPKCNKNITVTRIVLREEDGGIITEVPCLACHSVFQSFSIPDDFTEVYETDE